MGKTYSSLEKVINLMEAGLRDIKQVDPNDDSERIGRSSIHKSENTSDRVRSQLFNDLKKAENSHLWNNTEEVLNRIFDVVPELKKIYDNDYYGKIEDIEGKVPKSKQKFVIDILSNNRNLRKVLEPNNTNTPFENGMNKGIDSYVAKPNGENSDVEKELRLAEFKKLISTETSPKELVKILKQYPEYNNRGYITRLLSNTIDDEATIQHILKASGLEESTANISNTISEAANRYMPKVQESKDDYPVYHKSYTSAVQAIHDFAAQRGYELNDDEMFDMIGSGPRKPQEGDTNRFNIPLYIDGKEQKKALHAQVYGRGQEGYELNMYIS